MSKEYMVFTRKHRPQNFDDIMGQGQVALPLKRAIEQGRIMQAYLFSGPRGVGKTTTARVFAKAVNCENGPASNPCNKCSMCTEITQGNSMDVIEIDGASNRGIDRIRELREQVNFGAARSRYKIYIIDEVHMLTTEAFNALLKTLEEPPKHVIFIFATTDPQNIPQTILSRCQHFRFKRAAIKTITSNLSMIAAKEDIKAEEEALYLIARAADGALRDGQRIFDQAITYSKGENLTAAAVSEMLGEIEMERLLLLADAIIEKNLSSAIRITEAVFEAGYDLKNFVREFAEVFRNILIIKIVNGREAVNTVEEDFEKMKAISRKASKEEFLYILEKIVELEVKIARSHIPDIVIETFIANSVLALEGEIKNSSPGTKKKEIPAPAAPAPPAEKKENTAPQQPAEEKSSVNNTEAGTGQKESIELSSDSKKSGMLVADEIAEKKEIKTLTKEIIEKRWDDVKERGQANPEYEEISGALDNSGIVSYDNGILIIIAENSFKAERLRKQPDKVSRLVKEEFSKDIRCIIYEKDEYRRKYKVEKDVDQEEAMNHKVVQGLAKIFGVTKVEVKKEKK
ncbi:MAG: DNA polymerase III subunit gamma/tau [bacterium]